MKAGCALLALGLCLVLAPDARAQQSPRPHDDVYRAPRSADAAVLEAVRADRAFRYDEDAEPVEGMTFWEAVRRFLGEALRYLDSPLARPFTYLAFGALLVWAVLKLLRIEPAALLRRAAPAVRATGDMPESIAWRDFLAEARAARVAGDVRLAVRYLFLHTLARLDGAGLIAYRPEKTNRAYLREASGVRAHLEPLVRAFEVAWYGHVDPPGAAYDALERAYAALETALAHAR